MGLTLEQLARMYAVHLAEARDDGDWLILAAGTGLMMSVLDAVPRLRWYVDVDAMRAEDVPRLGRWLEGAQHLVGGVCAAGWYSRPDAGRPLAEALRGLASPPLVYLGANALPEMWAHCDFSDCLGAFLARLRARVGCAAAPARP